MVSQRTINQFQRLFKSNIYDQEFKDIFKFFQGVYGIHHFPQKILKILKTFDRCDLIIHPRGQLNSVIYSSIQDQENFLKAKSFNHIFSQIKKGKKGYFQIGSDLSDLLKMTGFYTGSIFTGSFFDAIIILTRQEFFPPEPDEIKKLQDLNKVIPHFIEKFLKQQESYEKNEDLINFFNDFPSPIYIENQKGDLLFQNEAYKQSNTIQSQFKLYKINNIYTYFDQGKVFSHTPEMFHQERVMLLGDLLNTLKHELSNPLFGLSMGAQILTDRSKQSELFPLIKEMGKSIDRCQNILNNFSNLYSQQKSNEPTSLINIVQEAITLSKSATKGIPISFAIPENQNNYIGEFNSTWILQILFNLIINSSQALSKTNLPQIKIAINLSDKIEIDVNDNGPGIQEKHIGKLFEIFHTTKKSGTGLGLAVSRNLALKMQGDLIFIQKESGAHFRLLLPRESFE